MGGARAAGAPAGSGKEGARSSWAPGQWEVCALAFQRLSDPPSESSRTAESPPPLEWDLHPQRGGIGSPVWGWRGLCTLIPWKQPSLQADAGAGGYLFNQEKDHSEATRIQCPSVSLKDTISKLLPLSKIAPTDVAQ